MKRNIIRACAAIFTLFVITFLSGCSTVAVNETQIHDISAVTEKTEKQPTQTPAHSPVMTSDVTQTPVMSAEIKSTQKPEETITPAPVSSPTPVAEAPVKETQTPEEIEEKELTCSLSVSCAAVLDNIDKLKEGKADLIPKDGVIYPEQTVVFYEGESVFNVLLREMKKIKFTLNLLIHQYITVHISRV